MLRNLRNAREAIRTTGGSIGHADGTRRNDAAFDQTDSPFLLVECGMDGLWHVYEGPFDTFEGVFNELRDACDHASNRARARKDLMVLVREKHSPVVNAYYPAELGALSKFFGRMR